MHWSNCFKQDPRHRGTRGAMPPFLLQSKFFLVTPPLRLYIHCHPPPTFNFIAWALSKFFQNTLDALFNQSIQSSLFKHDLYHIIWLTPVFPIYQTQLNDIQNFTKRYIIKNMTEIKQALSFQVHKLIVGLQN